MTFANHPSTVETLFVQEGTNLDYTAGADLLGGDVVQHPCGLAGVVVDGIDNGRLGAVMTRGVHHVIKDGTTGPVFAVGDPVWWDDTNKLAVPAGDADADFFLGTAIAAAGTNDDAVLTALNERLGSDANLSSVGTVAAAGSTQGDATAIVHQVTAVTAGDDTKGVILPTAVPGDPPRYILNSGTAGLKIYPATSDKINNGSANAAITILENTLAILVPTAADNWAAVFTVNA